MSDDLKNGRSNVINKYDGSHLAMMFKKIVNGFNIDLKEAECLTKHYSSTVVHGGKDSSAKAKSNTSSNLLGLFRRTLTSTPISFCNLMTLIRVIRADHVKFQLTVTKGGKEIVVEHEIPLTSTETRSKKW